MTERKTKLTGQRMIVLATLFLSLFLGGCEDEPNTTVIVNFGSAAAVLSGGQNEVAINATVNFNTQDIESADWSVSPEGPGIIRTGPLSALAGFSLNGVYLVTLTVTDKSGRVGTGSLTVDVTGLKDASSDTIGVPVGTN